MDDEDDYSEDGDDDQVFEAPAVQQQESTFNVLTPEECEAAANREVQSVCELLCCEASVAGILLRHFKWDRDKLTDGGCRTSARACPPPARACCCRGQPDARPLPRVQK